MSIVRSIIRSPIRSAIRSVLGASAGTPLVFHALTPNPTTYEMQGVLTGSGGLTEARVGELLARDFENTYRTFPTLTPVYQGGRVVENLAPRSNDLSTSWIKQTNVVATSVDDYWVLDFTASAENKGIFNSLAAVSLAATVVVSFWLRSPAGAGTITITEANNSSFSEQLSITSDWKKYAVSGTAVGTLVSAWFRRGSGDLNVVHFKELQVEETTGRTDTTTPSEYIPTTTAAVQKVFANENGNTVTSNVVTEATGAALASVPWLVGQPAHTNQLTYSRDLTNAAWTPRSPTVTSYDAVGLTGADNTATTLTDDDVDAYDRVLRTVTVPSDSNTNVLRALIKKDTDETRFPEVKLQYIGGTSGKLGIGINTKTGATVARENSGTTDSEVNSIGSWWEVLISVANGSSNQVNVFLYPAIGTTIGTLNVAATGSIIVGNAELHLNTTIAAVRGSSPIFTSGSTVTTNATDLSFDDANAVPQGGYFVEWTPQYATSEVSGNIELLSLDNNAGVLFYDASNSLLKSTDGTNTASVAMTIVAGATYKVWVAFGGTSLQVGFDATTGTAGTFDGAFTTGTKIEIVTPSVGTNLTRNLRAYNLPFSAAVTKLQSLAA